ncbi:MAG: hypothetical protein KTR14_09840 [Vampirovibrio sp.]|nr:hypothetical protein [Vampirovibrio sp.]
MDFTPVRNTNSVSNPIAQVNSAGATQSGAIRTDMRQLQSHDVYFSSQSFRAQIQHFLSDPHQQSLQFHFLNAQPNAFRFAQPPEYMKVAFSKAAIEESTKPLFTGERAVLHNSATASLPSSPLIEMHQLRYSDVRNPDVLTGAMAKSDLLPEAMDFNPKAPASVAYLPDKGEVIPFTEVTKTHRPVVEKALNWVRSLMDSMKGFGEKLSRLVHIAPDGKVSLLNGRIMFNPANSFTDASGHSAQPMDLRKLDGGVIRYEDGTALTFMPANGKQLAEQLEQAVRQVEEAGFQYLPSHSAATPSITKPPTFGQIQVPPSSTVFNVQAATKEVNPSAAEMASNPFAQTSLKNSGFTP